jgi:hypothetical protein
MSSTIPKMETNRTMGCAACHVGSRICAPDSFNTRRTYQLIKPKATPRKLCLTGGVKRDNWACLVGRLLCPDIRSARNVSPVADLDPDPVAEFSRVALLDLHTLLREPRAHRWITQCTIHMGI